ncbi:MAG: biotin transporter BioY [Planifilum sp.]
MSGEVLLLRNMIVAAMFAALVAVVGQLQIPLPIPITLQTMVVMMAGSVLGARWGAVSMGVFLLLVAFGAPLLAGGKGGMAVLAGPTGGYVWSWVLAAWLIGFLSERSAPLSVWKLMLYHVLGGMLLIYAGGVFWLVTGVGLGWKEALLTGVLPFIIGDLIKAAIAAFVSYGIYRAYPILPSRGKGAKA